MRQGRKYRPLKWWTRLIHKNWNVDGSSLSVELQPLYNACVRRLLIKRAFDWHYLSGCSGETAMLCYCDATVPDVFFADRHSRPSKTIVYGQLVTCIMAAN